MKCAKIQYTKSDLNKVSSIVENTFNKLKDLSTLKKIQSVGLILSDRYEISLLLIEDASLLLFDKIKSTNKESTPIDDIKTILSNKIKVHLERPSERYNKLLERYFGDESSIYIRNQQFRRDMHGNLFINVNDVTGLSMPERIVDSEKTLCSNIESQINKWFRDIVTYLGMSATRYYSNHERTAESYDVLIKMNHELESTSDETIRKRLKTGKNSLIKGQEEELDFYNAVNGYLNIIYFDLILRSQFKSIKIKNIPSTKIDKIYKYSFVNSGSELLKHGWNDKDAILDYLKEMGGLVLSTIESIPVRDYRGSEKKTKFYSYLTKEVFLNAITQVFDVINTSESQELYKLKQALIEFQDNSNKLEDILNLIFEKKYDESVLIKELKRNNVTDNQLNVLFSVRESMYTDRHSFLKIENEYIKAKGVSNRDSVTDALTNYIAGMTKMHYMQTAIVDGKVISYDINEVSNDRDRFNVFNKINSFKSGIESQLRDKIIKKYKFSVKQNIGIILSSGLKLSINLNNIFTTRYNDLNHNETDILFNDKKINYFEKEIDLLKSQEGIDHLLSGENLTDKEKEFKSLISMLDELLELRFGKDESGLNLLYILLNSSDTIHPNPNEALNNLIFTALKVLSNMDLISKIELNSKYEVTDILKYLEKNNWHGQKISLDSESVDLFMTDTLFGKQFKIIDGTDKWVDGYQYAINVLQGNFDKSVLTDPSGAKVPKYSNVFLAAKFRSILNDIKKNPNHICNGLSIVKGANRNSILSCVIDTYITINDQQKSITDLNHGELECHAIIDQFMARIFGSKEKHIIVQPTNVSDKKKVPKFLTNLLNFKLVGIADDENLYQAKDYVGRKRIKQMIFEDFKSYYSNMFNNMLEKYKKIFDKRVITTELTPYLVEPIEGQSEQLYYAVTTDNTGDPVIVNGIQATNEGNPLYYQRILDSNLTIELLLEKLRTIDLFDRVDNGNLIKGLITIAQEKGIELIENIDYIVNKTKGSLEVNPLLLYYNEILINTPGAFEEMLKQKEDEFIQDLIKDNVFFRTDNRLFKIRNILSNFVDNPDIWINKGVMLFKLDGKINPMIDYYFAVTTLLENALRLTLFDSEVSHTVKKYKNVIAEDGLEYSISDYILKFRKAPEGIDKVLNEAIQASTKRAGQLSSTLISLKQFLLNGISKKIKVAVAEDFEYKVFTPDGVSDKIKVHDGGGFILAFLKYFEDNSLQENKVGLIRKPILAWKNPVTGSSVQFKYAVNTLTNRFMRNSLSASFDTYELFKRMTNQIKFSRDTIDLLRNDVRENGKILFKSDILNKEEAYYWLINNEGKKEYRMITDFGYDEDQKAYYTIEKVVNINGKEIIGPDKKPLYETQKVYLLYDNNGNRVLEGGHTISSVYELYQCFGGMNSLQLHKGRGAEMLLDSERSMELTAMMMNNVNVLKNNVDPNKVRPTQEFYDQPLKEAVISCLLPHSAVKDGVGNINSSEIYDKTYNRGLNFMTVETTHYGPQNDSDHDAVESHLNELTLVMSSLDNVGRMHYENKLFYEVLGKTIDIFSRVPRTVVTKFRENKDRSGLYRYMAQLIIDNFDINKTDSTFGKKLIDKIAKELDKYDDQELTDIHFPFSEKNVRNIIANTVTSTLNKTAIKKQFSGGGMPMAPAFGFLQIYEIDGLTYQFDDLLNTITEDPDKLKEMYAKNGAIYSLLSKTELSKRLVYDYLMEKQEELKKDGKLDLNMAQILPSDIVHFYINDLLLNKQGFAFDDIDEYYSFKENPIMFLINKGILTDPTVTQSLLLIRKSVITPRNLAPDKMLITYLNGAIELQVNIFDMWPIKNKYFVSKATTIEQVELLVGYKNFQGLSLDDFKKSAIRHLNKKRDDILYKIEKENKYEDIDGTIYEVKDIDKKNFEGIFSNINANKFGLNETSSLLEVMKEGPDRFAHLLGDIEHTNPTQFTFQLRFLSSSPDLKDSFISFDRNFVNKHAKEIKQKEFKQKAKTFNLKKDSFVFQEIYSQNKDGDKEFLIGALIIDKSIVRGNDGIYRIENKPLDNLDDYQIVKINGKEYVVKTIYFVNNYEIDNEYNLFNINDLKINEYLVALTDNVPSTNDVCKQIGKILSDMYASKDFESIYVNKFIHSRLIPSLRGDLLHFANTLEYNKPLQNYIRQIGNVLRAYDKKSNDLINIYLYLDSNNKNIASYFEEYDNIRCRGMYSAFIKSLEFIVARIPSQSLQSFMKMNCVGFTHSEKNECYVSHFQTYLLGSDYDYDKGYVLGYSISNEGKFVGWSNLFDDFSIKTLNESLKIPYVINEIKIRKEEQVNDLDLISKLDVIKSNKEIRDNLKTEWYALKNELDNNIKISGDDLIILKKKISDAEKQVETAIINLIKSEIDLINYINSKSNYDELNKERVFVLPKDYDPEILKLIINHYNIDRIPVKQRENMMRNYVVNHIGNVITYLPNIISSHTAITMDDIRESTEYAEVKDNSRLSFYNPATKLKMQYKNMVGKKGTGISANGEKVSFNWHFFFREKLLARRKEVLFNFDAKRIIGRSTNTMSDDNVIKCLPDIIIDDYITNNNDALDIMLKNIRNTKGLLTGNIAVDNAISLILSASTDNAKELILEKLNGNENLLKCHLLLIALGVSLNDVAAFMSSAAVTWISRVTQGNMYYGKSNLSMFGAITLALNPKKKSSSDAQYILELIDSGISPEEIESSLNSGSNIPTVPTDAELRQMSSVHNTRDDFEKDILQFKTVLKAANEFTNGAKLLRLNQGVPGTTYTDLIDFIDSFEDMISQAEIGIDNLDEIRNLFMEDNKEKCKEAKFNPGNFKVEKFLQNFEYRKLTAKYYEKLKTVLNIFDLMNNLPHFKKMMDVVDIAYTLTRTPVITNKATKAIYDSIKGKYNITDRVKNGISNYIESKLIMYYLKQNDFVIPIPSLSTIFNEYWDKSQPLSNELVINDAMSTANFKYIFETFIIPQLKNGTYYTIKNGDVEFETSDELRDNKFIQLLVPDDNQEGMRYYKEDVDTSNMKKRFITYNLNDAITAATDAFESLKKYEFGKINERLGRRLNILDLFIIYNLVVNKNSSNRNSLTNFFNLDDDNSLLSDYVNTIGLLDWDSTYKSGNLVLKILDYSEEDFLISIAKKINDLNNRTAEPIVYIDKPYGRVYYKNTKSGKKYYLTIDLNSQTGSTVGKKAEKLANMISYSVLSNNYKIYLNQKLSILNLDNIFLEEDNVLREDRLNAAINILQQKIRYRNLGLTINCY